MQFLLQNVTKELKRRNIWRRVAQEMMFILLPIKIRYWQKELGNWKYD